MSAERNIQPLPGVRVYLTKTTDDKMLADSITAQDGSYYLGDIKPGKYYLRVDPKSLPPKHRVPDPRMIDIKPNKEPQEITTAPLVSPAAEEDRTPKGLPIRSELGVVEGS